MAKLERFLLIGFILTFAFLSLCISFFHTEDSITESSNCPACHFLASSLSVSAAVLFVLPMLICFGASFIGDLLWLSETGARNVSSRSPPAA